MTDFENEYTHDKARKYFSNPNGKIMIILVILLALNFIFSIKAHFLPSIYYYTDSQVIVEVPIWNEPYVNLSCKYENDWGCNKNSNGISNYFKDFLLIDPDMMVKLSRLGSTLSTLIGFIGLMATLPLTCIYYDMKSTYIISFCLFICSLLQFFPLLLKVSSFCPYDCSIDYGAIFIIVLGISWSLNAILLFYFGRRIEAKRNTMVQSILKSIDNVDDVLVQKDEKTKNSHDEQSEILELELGEALRGTPLGIIIENDESSISSIKSEETNQTVEIVSTSTAPPIADCNLYDIKLY